MIVPRREPPRPPESCCGVAVSSRVVIPIDRGAVARERLYWRWGRERGDPLRRWFAPTMSVEEDDRGD